MIDWLHHRSMLLFIFLLSLSAMPNNAQPSADALIERPADFKDFKKLLRLKTNVLVLFANGASDTAPIRNTFNVLRQSAELAFGKATIAFVNCQLEEGKKLCKKLKVAPNQPTSIKHYHNGEYNKDYDRQLTAQSVFRFLEDPTGDMPWEEDDEAKGVVHLADNRALTRLLKTNRLPTLIMFYAPWCGHCKRLKPEYAAAARELEGKAALAAMDLNRPENSEVQRNYDVQGFPTLVYFEEGKFKFRYGGEPSKDGIIKWLQNPTPKKEDGDATGDGESKWSDEETDVVHLTDATFAPFIAAHPSVLIMFYAPWCGYCKRMKPDYIAAAARLKEQNADLDAVLAAVDATENKAVSTQYNIQGFPTVKYFKDSAFAWDFTGRTEDEIYKFMINPVEPPPPPPPEIPWKDEQGDVVHLDSENFRTELRKKKHALVMFYAPWCGHCKRAKPEFSNAATTLKDDVKVLIGAVDCTADVQLCTEYKVAGYPTFIYFSYLKNQKPYTGGHQAHDFMLFIQQNAGNTIEASPPATESSNEIVFDAAVHIASPANFDALIADGDVPALVMFFAPWCGHCKQAKEPFGSAAASTKSAKYIAIDCTKHQEFCNTKDIKGYPTFKIYQNGKFVKDYSNDRTVTGFSRFASSLPSTTTKTEL